MIFWVVHFPGRGQSSAVACFRCFVEVFVDDLAVVAVCTFIIVSILSMQL